MKIAYVKRKFGKSTVEIINQANNIIEEYEDEGMSLTLRQLYYQFVARGLLENKQKEYGRLGGIINKARLAGLIDWSSIKDLTRTLKSKTHWVNPAQIIRAATRGYRLDHWEGQEYRIEVWIEKEALISVISNICETLDIDYFACRGYVSQSEMWKASQRFTEYRNNGQEPIIIHLGDHDPSGIDMTRDIKNRQNVFKIFGFHIERIALNIDQVKQYNPPPNPAKITDSRFNTYLLKYGDKSWELDALEPIVLRSLIKDTVLKYRNEYIYNQVLDREARHLDILKNVEENWETLKEG